MSWHTSTVSQVLEGLVSRENGLSQAEAIERIKLHGENRLPEGKTDNLLTIFIRQFQSPLIYVLFAAATAVFLMGDRVDALIIGIVLVFNAVVGSIQEGRAQNTLLALRKFTETAATVMRDGKEIIIKGTEVVPGDVMILQEGEKVPADGRIIFENTLKIDEASLTGESEPVAKIHEPITASNIPIVDQKNMVFKGTNVLSGNGSAVVVATGVSTEIGKIAKEISAIDTEIPLKRNIRYLSRAIIIAVFVLSLCLIGAGVLTGKSLQYMFTTTVALAVSVIPEGLPIVITLVLATGVRRMSRHNVLVKRLQAVEALGQTKVVAVDKTGTLTRNEMVVSQVFVGGSKFEIEGDGYEPKGEVLFENKVVDPLSHPKLLFIAKVSAFCTNAKISWLKEEGVWKTAGDPTEVAMLSFSQKIGFVRDVLEQEYPKKREQPFDYVKKYHTTERVIDNKNFVSVVGAPEEVLGLCQRVWREEGERDMDQNIRKEIEAIFYQFAREGLRVVACAVNVDAEEVRGENGLPTLSFVGFLGMRDPLREEVKNAVMNVRAAGMYPVMITGDHRLTAEAIGRQAGIFRDGDNILTGEEINKMDAEELISKLDHTTIFARVTPEHKLRIIEAFRKRGEIVAMTGDGVNDAPSLVAADLGVAMGKIGTEVAKEASDLILLDDNFAGIVRAAEEGRSIYKTIKKVILYLFSTSLGEILVITTAIFSGFPLPLLATQIIWLNFVTDGFLTVALAMEPKERVLMKEKFKKPQKWIVDRLMAGRMITMSLPMAIGTFWIFLHYLSIGEEVIKAQTIALVTLAAFQWFNAWNCRSEEKSVFSSNPFSNFWLVAATITVIALQLFALHNGFLQKVLHVVPLSVNEWFYLVPVAASVVVVEEIRKIFYRRSRSGKS